MQSKMLSFLFAAAAVAMLAGCSGGKSSSNTTSTTTTTTTQSSPGASPAGSPAASAPGSPAASAASSPGTAAAPGANAMSGAMAAHGSPQPIPASVQCAGGQAPVWTNARSHAYHVASDPLYGRTKHGKYMCLRDAVNAGYHAAGAHHHAAGSNGTMAQPSPSPSM